MLKFAELLMFIGTVLIIVGTFMVGTILGLMVTGITCLLWGIVLLKIIGNVKEGGG